jgi:hypothetical protein
VEGKVVKRGREVYSSFREGVNEQGDFVREQVEE